MNGRQVGIKARTVEHGVPLQRGCGGGRRRIAWPGPRRIVHGKPGQRAIGGVGLQRGIEGTRRLVAHATHAPGPLRRSRLHRVQHGTQFARQARDQHLARRAQGAAQARRSGVLRVGKVDLGDKCQNRLWRFMEKR